MPTCPAGHESTSTDFCDNCGMRIGGAAPAASASAASSPGGAAPAGAAPDIATAAGPPPAPAEPCPVCATPRSGQFCEACGYDFASGSAPAASTQAAPSAAAAAPAAGDGAAVPVGAVAPAGSAASAGPVASAPAVAAPGAASGPGWTAVVTADRAYFDSVVAGEGPDAGTLEFPGYCPERRFRLAGQEMRIGRRSVSRGLEPEIDLTGPPADPGVSHMHAVLIAQPDGGWAIVDPGSANGTKVNDNDLSVGVRVPLHDGDRICLGAWTMLTIQSS